MEKDIFNEDAFVAAMKEVFPLLCEAPRTFHRASGNYTTTFTANAWTMWKRATQAEVRRTMADAVAKPAPVKVSEGIADSVLESLRTLVKTYVRSGDGSIAMIAANNGAHPAIRDAWKNIYGWLEICSERSVLGDLDRMREMNRQENYGSEGHGEMLDARMGEMMPAASTLNVSTWIPMKKIRKAIRETIREEFERANNPLEATHTKAGEGEFDGSNADPKLTVTLPTLHDGNGDAATFRLTGLMENAESGEKWTVGLVLNGQSGATFVRDAIVTRLPE